MKFPSITIAVVLGICGTLVSFSSPLVANTIGSDIKTVVRDAFQQVHAGWSTDEVLLQTELNRKFVAACQQRLPDEPIANFNWTLLNLRKAGNLDVEVTKRRTDRHEAYAHLAEIAARTIQDKHQVNTDRMMCDERLREAFDQQARLLAPDVDAYRMRKAAFGLRKRRQLQPELLLRIADWGRDVHVHSIQELIDAPSSVPDQPGVYLFRDATGYLYVGESKNLRQRLAKHLESSDRITLARYLTEQRVEGVSVELHVFPKKSRASQLSVRRAYESALIASRKPRFNLRP